MRIQCWVEALQIAHKVVMFGFPIWTTNQSKLFIQSYTIINLYQGSFKVYLFSNMFYNLFYTLIYIRFWEVENICYPGCYHNRPNAIKTVWAFNNRKKGWDFKVFKKLSKFKCIRIRNYQSFAFVKLNIFCTSTCQ